MYVESGSTSKTFRSSPSKRTTWQTKVLKRSGKKALSGSRWEEHDRENRRIHGHGSYPGPLPSNGESPRTFHHILGNFRSCFRAETGKKGYPPPQSTASSDASPIDNGGFRERRQPQSVSKIRLARPQSPAIFVEKKSVTSRPVRKDLKTASRNSW